MFDTFTRANSTTTLGSAESGEAWQTDATWGIASNRAYCVAGSGAAWALGASPATTVDMDVTYASSSTESLIIRLIDNSNYLNLIFNDTTVYLYKKDGGSYSPLASVGSTQVPGATYQFRAEVVGNVFTAYRDGSFLLSTTLSGGDATKYGVGSTTTVGVGMRSSTNNTYYDNLMVDAYNAVGAVMMSAAPVIGMTLSDNDLGMVTMSAAPVIGGMVLSENDLGMVAMAVGPGIEVSLQASGDIGAVSMSAGLSLAVAVSHPGTLASPYQVSDEGTFAVDFNEALFVPEEPVPLTGPSAAPSIWFEFTESQSAQWTGSTSGFASGATIEIYTGPHGATTDDLTFIGTDGMVLVGLGDVNVGALATLVVTPFEVQGVDLGVVDVATLAQVEMALT